MQTISRCNNPLMIAKLHRLLRAKPARAPAAVPAGQRVYAVGDIHGRRDLFDAMAAAIDADDAARSPAETTVILLGDLVDRGPDSAGVISAARDWQARRKVRIIAGNHEEMFLQSFSRVDVLRRFLRYGGRETVLSYPVNAAEYNAASLDEAQVLMRRAVPREDLSFMRSFEDRIMIGDYLFVHAGIEPGIAANEQSLSDLRWIREPFLSHEGDHGHIVVHGHTIFDQADICSNRIGIDTGAFASGLLTALCLEGQLRRLIEVREVDGMISASVRPA